MKKILIAVMMLAFLSLATPAQAHTSVCKGGWNKPTSSQGLIHAYGQVQCGPGWHASKQVVFSNIQVYQKRWWGSSWKNMYPTYKDVSYQSGMKFDAHAPCLKGTHTYRAEARHTQQGYHDTVSKKFRSPTITLTCR